MPVPNLNPWSYDYIRKLRDEATELARQNGLRPALASEVVMNWRHRHRFNIPFLGDYVPSEWVRMDDVEPVIVSINDSSLNPPVINKFEFFQHVTEQPKHTGYGVIEMGQTQVLIATYRRKETHEN